MKLHVLFLSIFIYFNVFSQQRVHFEAKKIPELGINIDEYDDELQFLSNIPIIWKRFDINNDENKFYGYYTLSPNSMDDLKILNGEIKFVKYEIGVGEEALLNLKSELIYNCKEGQMNGPVTFNRYYSTDQYTEMGRVIMNSNWKKDLSITARYDMECECYKNITYNQTSEWDRTKYNIMQAQSYDISLDYFNTILSINTSPVNQRPVFKKIKY